MPLNVQIRRVRARDVREQPVNARYMAKSEYDALVANIRRDGVLTSTPLLYQPGGTGPIDVVSGHHRNRATLEALGDDAEYDAMVILDEQSRDEIIARQISHNSIAGQDDPALLAQLWNQIEDVDMRRYAALDDKTLEQLAPRELYDPTLDALATAHAAWRVGNVATALELILDVYEKHLEDTQAGWLDEAGEPTRKDGVPVESVVGARQVDAAAAAVIARAVKKVRRDAGDPQMAAGRALELLAADYLGGA
jgi:hypothetical protein